MTDDTLEPVTPDDESVIDTAYDSFLIGSTELGDVYLPPEDADPQGPTIVHLLTTERVGNRLWAAGFKSSRHYQDILSYDAWEVSLGGGGAVAYAYTVAYADGSNPVEDQYRDTVRDHHRANCPIDTKHSH